MKKIFVFFICFSINISILFSQEQLKVSVFFETGESSLTSKSKTTLEELAQKTKGLATYTVELHAHTDNQGTAEDNKKLARKRALSIEHYLFEIGIDADEKIVKNFGEKASIYLNTDEINRSKNRRVDVIITYHKIESIDDLFDYLKRKSLQVFTIPPDKNVVINAKNGTQIRIRANSFILEDGTIPKENITFQIKEAYSYGDIITHNLSTTSNGELLETGGMVFTNAEVNGKPLKLKTSSSIGIGFPTLELKDGMMLYISKTDENGNVNWLPTSQNFATNISNDDFFKRLPNLIRPEPPSKYRLGEEKAYRKPVLPKKPSEIYKPAKPQRPIVEKTRGKKGKIAAENAEISYQKQQKKYAEKLKNYKKKLEIRNAEMVIYQEKMKIYHQELKKYEAAIKAYILKRGEHIMEVKPNLFKEMEENGKPIVVRIPEEIPKEEQLKNQMKYEKDLAIFKEAQKNNIEKWRAYREKSITDYEASYEEIGNTTFEALNTYLYQFEIKNVNSWVNVDVPVRKTAAQVSLIIRDEDEEQESVFVLVKNTKTMMIPRKNIKNFYETPNIQRGHTIIVIGLKVVNGKVMLAKIDSKVGLKPSYTLTYQPSTLKELKKELMTMK